MAELGTIFDATLIDPKDPFDLLPAGKYVAEIVESEIKATKDGSDRYLELTFEITEGEHTGRKLWDRLCLFHTNETTRSIAQRRLSALCHAAGKLRISESEELHHTPVELHVRVGKPRDGYDPTNEIRKYSAANGAKGPVPNGAADLNDDIPF
jgi:hypothetical protein